MAKERIGIMGGSFNPIHRRHLEIARCAMRELSLDGVLFIPTGNPPHKHDTLVPAEHRYEMTRLAVLPFEKFTASRIEIDREGVIYSVDTLRLLKNENPRNDYIFIIGEDTLNDLPNWRRPDEVFSLCSFAVCSRTSENTAVLPAVKELQKHGARFSFLTLPPSEISSTRARFQLQEGQTPDCLPPQVMEYIRIFGLYGITPLPGGKEIYQKLRASLNHRRFLHSLLVADTAVQLAGIFHENQLSAELAGLLHDCAKCLSLEEMQKIALDNHLSCDRETMHSGNLLHGPAGAALAQTVYGIDGEDIKAAISCHTTGKLGMLPLDMILFLADKTEPGRGDYPLLSELRQLSRENLTKATLLSLESSRSYVEGRGGTFYEGSLKAIEWLKYMLTVMPSKENAHSENESQS